MVRESGFPQRRSIRLRAFDYRAPGCYVVTICTQHRKHLFGEMAASPPWANLNMRARQHGRPRGGALTGSQDGADTGGQLRLSSNDVMERFKSLTTYRYGDAVWSDGWPPHPGKPWQRDYYERVIRNEAELTKFRNSIENNPARWFEDPYRSE